MRDVRFEIELRWSGTGRAGAGQVLTDDLELELSAPEPIGGRGVGTNPEELLVSAVSSCYTATLFAVPDRAKLPIDSLVVEASGTVAVLPTAALAMTSDESRPLREHAEATREGAGPRSPDQRTAGAAT